MVLWHGFLLIVCYVDLHDARQPPEVCLQLGVVEARNLKGKDVNGQFYCHP